MSEHDLNSAAYAALAGHPSKTGTERWVAGVSASFQPFRPSFWLHGPASTVLAVCAADQVDPQGLAITDFLVGHGKSRQLRALVTALGQTVPQLGSDRHPIPDSPPVALSTPETLGSDDGGENVISVEIRVVDGGARFIARASFLSVAGGEDGGKTVLAGAVQTAASPCAWCAHRTLAEILALRFVLADQWAQIAPLAPELSQTFLFGNLDPFRSCTAVLRAPGPNEVAEITRLLTEAQRESDA